MGVAGAFAVTGAMRRRAAVAREPETKRRKLFCRKRRQTQWKTRAYHYMIEQIGLARWAAGRRSRRPVHALDGRLQLEDAENRRMCGVCGCGQEEMVLEKSKAGAASPDGSTKVHEHVHDRGDGRGPHAHSHPHDERDHGHQEHAFGPRLAHDHDHSAPAPGVSPHRMIKIEQDILSKNDAYARENRRSFAAKRLFVLNVVSSPGSGKTCLLVKAIEALKDRIPVAVIEGDQQTSNDAERIRATGAPAIQINTGKGCHLDAHMVGHALETLDPSPGSALFIENVGNLVCPAAFDLGEARRVVVLSVTEGEDKPLKYPDMFATADLLLLNKADLLPHLDFDVGQCLANAMRVNPNLQTLIVSARTGEGLSAFAAWIEASAARHGAALGRA